MTQHMYCPERKSQEQGPSDEYMFSTEINTLINNNKQTQCCFLCMIVLWDNERACFIFSNKFTGLAVISHVTAQLPRRAKVCLGLGFKLMRQNSHGESFNQHVVRIASLNKFTVPL